MIIACHDPHVLEVSKLEPILPGEYKTWLEEHDINYSWFTEKYGPGRRHYFGYIRFENIEDAVTFKLVFG